MNDNEFLKKLKVGHAVILCRRIHGFIDRRIEYVKEITDMGFLVVHYDKYSPETGKCMVENTDYWLEEATTSAMKKIRENEYISKVTYKLKTSHLNLTYDQAKMIGKVLGIKE